MERIFANFPRETSFSTLLARIFVDFPRGGVRVWPVAGISRLSVCSEADEKCQKEKEEKECAYASCDISMADIECLAVT